jgi:hypothetical protein
LPGKAFGISGTNKKSYCSAKTSTMVRNVKKHIPIAVIMLGIVSLLTDAASEMIYPLIPVFVSALGSGRSCLE